MAARTHLDTEPAIADDERAVLMARLSRDAVRDALNQLPPIRQRRCLLDLRKLLHSAEGTTRKDADGSSSSLELALKLFEIRVVQEYSARQRIVTIQEKRRVEDQHTRAVALRVTLCLAVVIVLLGLYLSADQRLSRIIYNVSMALNWLFPQRGQGPAEAGGVTEPMELYT